MKSGRSFYLKDESFVLSYRNRNCESNEDKKIESRSESNERPFKLVIRRP